VSVANEYDIELNKRREIPYLQVTMYYCVYYINTKAHNITGTILKTTVVSVMAEDKSNSS